MNVHDATEIAFKNGYEKAAREIFEDIEFLGGALHNIVLHPIELSELKKKYKVDV